MVHLQGGNLNTCGGIVICHSDWREGFNQQLVGRDARGLTMHRKHTHHAPQDFQMSCQTFMWTNCLQSHGYLFSSYFKVLKTLRKVSKIIVKSFLLLNLKFFLKSSHFIMSSSTFVPVHLYIELRVLL